MDTLLLRPHRQKGPIFLREVQGVALILSPHAPLGNLNEEEITAETLELLEIINHSPPTNVVIDLAQGDYLGSAFLGAVVRLWKRIGQRGGRLAMCNVSEPVLHILRVTKLHASWPIHPTRDAALSSFG